MTQDQDEEPRKRRTISRRYENEGIRVKWEPEFCIHSGMCWRNLPNVFRPREMPWIVLDGVTAAEVARTVSQCPSGALSFERLDGGVAEPVPEQTTIEASLNGPLYLRGRIRILDSQGNLMREANRVALCRCGQSANKPFCDQTHQRIGFRAE